MMLHDVSQPLAGDGEGSIAAPRRHVFVFVGQGSQWPGMGRDLYERPAFRRRFDEVSDAIRAAGGPDPVHGLLRADAEELARIGVAQPLLFALQLALVEQLAADGITADAVVGHSMGEVVAAVVSGALELTDGVRVILARCRALERIEGDGAMLAVGLGEDVLSAALGSSDVTIAVVNDHSSCVVAGEVAPLEAWERRFQAAGVWARRLSVRHASHSAFSRRASEHLAVELADLRASACRIPMVSTTTGSWAQGPELDGAHWARNEGERVRFREAVDALIAAGHGSFLEVSPHPSLTVAVQRQLERAGVADGFVRGALRRDLPAAVTLATISSPPRPAPSADPAAAPGLPEIVGGVLGRPCDPAATLASQGLDSIRALELQAALQSRFALQLPLVGLSGATLSDLQAAIDEGREPDPTARPLVDRPLDRFRPFPLTDLQRAYLLGRESGFELGGVSPALVVENELAELDLDRLVRAVRALVARHDALHTRYDADGQQVLAHLTPPTVPVLEVDDPEALEQARRLGPGPTPLDVRVLRQRGRQLVQLRLDLLAVDGRSIEVLFEELNTLYVDPDAPLPPVAGRYRDWVVSTDPEPAAAAAYWKARTLPPAPVLPRVARTEARPPRFVRRRGELDAGRWQALVRRARAHDLSPAVVLATVYAEVLATWSTSAHFALNVMSLRRPADPRFERVVGNFATTLLLEVDLRARLGFVERAVAVQRQLWSDLEHASFSGVRVLQEVARLTGERAYAPVVFACGFDRPPSGPTGPFAWHGPGPSHSGLQTPQVLVDHQVFWEPDGSLSFNWDVVEDELRPGVAAEMFDAYVARLRQLADHADHADHAEHPDVRGEGPLSSATEAVDPWSEWCSLTPASALRLVEQVNTTRTALPTGSLHGPILAAARRRPDAIALVTPSRSLTFGELVGLGRASAAAVGAGHEVVAVVAHKGWEEVCASLGVLLAGAAYVPIDAGLPPKRMQQLLELSGAAVALVQPGVEVPSTRVRPVPIPTRPAAASGLEVPEPGPDDLAYVIFTSGSTGQPKGVEIQHGAARNTIEDLDQRFAIGPDDAVLGVSSMSFDLSVYDVFGVLGAGGRLVLPDPRRRHDPEHWLDLLRAHRVTLWNSAPALMSMLATHQSGLAAPVMLPDLRLALLSGDWIPVRLPSDLVAFAPGCRVVSLGGATEVSIWSCFHEIRSVDPNAVSIPYGRALANQEMVVLDEWLAPRPLQVAGRIFLGGVGLARGYRGDPEKTAAAFAVHPDGVRRYLTGDWGRLGADGEIEFLGRQDTQVKIRGHRIELGEIEAALHRHPAVDRARVGVVGDGRAKALAAQIVPVGRPGENLVEELRAHLLDHLPPHMVPAHLLVVSELKLSANGKVDLRLPALPSSGSSSSGSDAPGSDLPPELVLAWHAALPGLPFAPERDFFESGGDSFVAVQLLADLGRRFGRAVPLAAFLRDPTLRGLAAFLGGGSGAEPDHLVVLQPDQPDPLVVVHPIGGQVLCYSSLARELPTRRVVALQALARVSAGATVGELAEAYLGALAAGGEHPPRVLGGWSFGGVVAHEMARRLEQRGVRVDQLILWDAPTPAAATAATAAATAEATVAAPTGETRLFGAFLADLARSRGLTLELGEADTREALLDRARRSSALGSVPDRDLLAWFELYAHHQRALDEHRPGLVHAPTLVVEAAHESHVPDWTSHLAGPVRTIRVPTDHYGVLQPAPLSRVLPFLL